LAATTSPRLFIDTMSKSPTKTQVKAKGGPYRTEYFPMSNFSSKNKAEVTLASTREWL